MRKFFKTKRAAVSFEKHQAAALAIAAHDFSGLTLSYMPIGSELMTTHLNQRLAMQKRLVLPKVEGHHLRFFLVSNLSSLKLNTWKIAEPDPVQCQEIDLSEITAVLVPALAFDQKGFRLGLGKGYYDRLLPQLKPSQISFGIGYREQLSSLSLALEAHDVPVKDLALF